MDKIEHIDSRDKKKRRCEWGKGCSEPVHCPEKYRATMLKIKIATRMCLHSALHVLNHVFSLASWSFEQTHAP